MTARSRLCLLVICALATVAAAAAPVDHAALVEGVREIAAPGWPGCLSVCGEKAFVVIAGKANNKAEAAVAAAAELDGGRLVALAHDGYLQPEALKTADTARFILNCTRWLGRAAKPQVLLRGLPDLAASLAAEGLQARSCGPTDWQAQLKSSQVLVLAGTGALSRPEVAALLQFVREGGGLLCADTPWGWLQMNPGKRLTTDHAGNTVLGAAGLFWSDGGLSRTSSAGFSATTPPSEFVHAGQALAAVEAQARGERQLAAHELAQATWSLTQAARAVPPGDTTLMPRLRQLAEANAAAAVPLPDKPLKLDQPLPRLALTLQLAAAEQQPPAEVKAHPAAAGFPGGVPAAAPRLERTLTLDTRVPDWHSTGLYAAPGEVLRVELPATAAGKGLGVRIGCHTDGLWDLDTWKRVPAISRSWPLPRPLTEVASPFGGLVYLTVPDNCKLGAVPVTVKGAVGAPYFVLGHTDPVQWRAEQRDLPAPWAELECRQVIISVPSEVVRTLDNPLPLMEFWAHVVDCCADLSARPLLRERPERYVADVQISAGYMHSGYPIMTHLDAAKGVVNLPQLESKGSWGHFHEMGHNHQGGDWTFSGAGEVTVNLFSLYCLDRCCAAVAAPGHPALQQDQRDKKLREYLQAGAPFEKWKSDPFLALSMYAQLQEAFGWEPYKRVFAEYRALPEGERPHSDDEKRDQWLVRFSRTVGRDLGPFFETWGVPTSQQARDSVKDLPPWMPEGFPPK